MENIVTSEYSVEVMDTSGKFLRQVELFDHYKDTEQFMSTNPLLDTEEHYRVMRTDYIEDEEIGVECVYEQETSTNIAEE